MDGAGSLVQARYADPGFALVWTGTGLCSSGHSPVHPDTPHLHNPADRIPESGVSKDPAGLNYGTTRNLELAASGLTRCRVAG